MQKITHWEVKRSGPLMVVSGLGEDGRPAKLTRVARIKRTEGGTVAEQDGGLMVELI